MPKQNEIIRYPFEVYDASDQPLTGESGNVVTRLTHNGANASEAVTVSEIGSTGRYEATFTPTSLGTYKLTVDKTGISADTRIEVSDPWIVEESDLDDIHGDIKRALGLLGDNSVIDYDWTDTNNDVATIWIYDSKANAQTHDEVTGLLYKYAVACTFTGRLANIATKTRES